MKFDGGLQPTGEGMLMPWADALHSDEPAAMLREVNLLTSDLKEVHRWQIVTVVRNDRFVEFPRSLGLASNFDGVSEIVIFADNDKDTVDMLMETADSMRAENQIAKLVAEDAEASTLLEDAYKYFDERRARLLNKTHFSNTTGKMVQRTGLKKGNN